MTELKYELTNHLRSLNKKRRKRWEIALVRANNEGQATQNRCVEAAYHKAIKFIKSSHLQPGKVYFERDWKNDSNYGIFNMHSFVTSSFSWSLDCSLLYDYEVQYSFGDCPFRESILKMLTAYPLDRQCKLVALDDYNLFYESVLNEQPKRFHFTF